MAKNTNRVASAIAYVAALMLATGALAATHPWELDVAEPVTYAKEIFGGDAMVLALGEDANGNLTTTVTIKPELVADVSSDAQADVTFTLTGGTFGAAVRWADIVVGEYLTKVAASQKYGRAGDSSVMVTIKATSKGIENKAGEADKADVSLSIASVKSAKGNVNATASIVATGGSASFPEGAAAPRRAVAAVAGVAAVKDDKGVDITPAVVAVAADPGTSSVVASAKMAQTFSGTDGDKGQINLAKRGLLTVSKLAVGTLSYTADPEPLDAEGNSFAGTTAGTDGEGTKANVHITASGMIRAGDTVYFDQNDDGKKDDKEVMDIAGEVAKKTFRLSNITEKTGTVYFVPGGVTPLTRGELTASFEVEYDSPTVENPPAEEGGATLEYDGIDQIARAYAIPNPGMNDVGNVRIKCGASGETKCTVFLDCNEQDGTPQFGEWGEIKAGATEVLQAEGIADVLKVDGWDRRLSCDVLSSHAVSVQVLVRSGDSLINNTYIGDSN